MPTSRQRNIRRTHHFCVRKRQLHTDLHLGSILWRQYASTPQVCVIKILYLWVPEFSKNGVEIMISANYVVRIFIGTLYHISYFLCVFRVSQKSLLSAKLRKETDCFERVVHQLQHFFYTIAELNAQVFVFHSGFAPITNAIFQPLHAIGRDWQIW